MPPATRVGRCARAYRTSIIAGVSLLAAVACDSRRDAVILEADDLIGRLSSAERRSAGPLDDTIRVEAAGPEDDRRVSIVTVPPVRIIWTGRVPPRAWIDTAVLLAGGAGATARIGISDHRVYEGLAHVELKPGAAGSTAWQPVHVDLGKYSGWQWSVFYRPSETQWQLVFSADATPGGTIVWARPMVKRRR